MCFWTLQERKKNTKLENVSIAKALQLEAARRRRAVPIRFNKSPVASLKSLSLSVAVLERVYCWYVMLRCELEPWPRHLDLWPLTFNLHSVSSVTWWNSMRNVSEIGQSAAELFQFEIWSYDLEHVSRAPLCAGIVCTMFKLSQAIHSWNMTIFHANTSYHAMTLTINPLTLKVCGRSGVTWS